MNIKFRGGVCFLYVNEDIYDILTSHKLFDKKNCQFVGDDRELDFLCKVVPGFEKEINDYVCDYVKVFLEAV